MSEHLPFLSPNGYPSSSRITASIWQEVHQNFKLKPFENYLEANRITNPNLMNALMSSVNALGHRPGEEAFERRSIISGTQLAHRVASSMLEPDYLGRAEDQWAGSLRDSLAPEAFTKQNGVSRANLVEQRIIQHATSGTEDSFEYREFVDRWETYLRLRQPYRSRFEYGFYGFMGATFDTLETVSRKGRQYRENLRSIGSLANSDPSHWEIGLRELSGNAIDLRPAVSREEIGSEPDPVLRARLAAIFALDPLGLSASDLAHFNPTRYMGAPSYAASERMVGLLGQGGWNRSEPMLLLGVSLGHAAVDALQGRSGLARLSVSLARIEHDVRTHGEPSARANAILSRTTTASEHAVARELHEVVRSATGRLYTSQASHDDLEDGYGIVMAGLIRSIEEHDG